MAWLDQLKQASFGGVPFHVDSVEVTAGDTVVLREYPFQDLPQVFRMGDSAERIRFNAYVIGPDYQARRDALRAVLSGQRVLIHPTAGSMRAFALTPYTIKEAPLREGTVVRFDLEFVRADARVYPVASANTQAQAAGAAAAAKSAAVDQFGAEFSLASAPAWAQSRVVDRLSAMLDGTWAQLKGATSTLGAYTDTIVGNYQVLRGGLADLVGTPTALAGAVRLLFELPSDLTDSTAGALRNAYQGLFGLGSRVLLRDFEVRVEASEGQLAMLGLGRPEALGVDTVARQQLAALHASVDRLVETMAVSAWLETVVAVDLPGYDEVQAWRATLDARCTELLVTASTSPAPTLLPTTNWHDAVLALMTCGLADLQHRGRDQARLTPYTPKATSSIWAVSFLLYGTADYADEILAMNPHITHPMLVPGGLPLKVVDRG